MGNREVIVVYGSQAEVAQLDEVFAQSCGNVCVQFLEILQ